MEILLIFSHFLVNFQFSPIFLVIFEKKILKRGQMNWNLCQLLGKHDFWAIICSRAKIPGGGGGLLEPPPSPGKASQTSVWLELKPCSSRHFLAYHGFFRVKFDRFILLFQVLTKLRDKVVGFSKQTQPFGIDTLIWQFLFQLFCHVR